jgi:periplasmic protein TonB
MQHTTALIARRMAQRRLQAGRVSSSLARRAGVGAALMLAAGMVAWGLSSLSFDPPAPKRQVARIALLPDTPPPPPPPPPKEQKKEEPTPQARPQPRPDDAPKPQAPANEPLKMEGAAGDGPSAFAAGAVSNDYRGGPVSTGPAASAPNVADRAAERLYANTVRQLLQADIERRLAPEAGEQSATFALWIGADGSIDRWEADAAQAPLKTALDASADSLRLPAPPTALAQQPLRFRLTVRAGA